MRKAGFDLSHLLLSGLRMRGKESLNSWNSKFLCSNRLLKKFFFFIYNGFSQIGISAHRMFKPLLIIRLNVVSKSI